MLLAILYFGVAARFRNLAERKSQNKWLQGLIVFPLFIIVMAVLTIPSEMYHHHISRGIRTIRPGMGIMVGRLGQEFSVGLWHWKHFCFCCLLDDPH